MTKQSFSRITRFAVIFVLIAAMALCIISCGGKETKTPESTSQSQAEITVTVTVVDDKGESKGFELKTSKDNLGDALIESGLVEGEKAEYGLYIKTVNDLRADYDLDGAYWALSKGGEYLMTGADETPISDGDKFELTYTKG